MNTDALFNSPIEFGLRTLILLAESYPRALDIQRLAILDFLLVHSGDIQGGPPSIHPASPLRAGEITIRRKLIENGIHLLASKGLVTQIVNPNGFSYKVEELAPAFLDSLSSDYARSMRDRAVWAIQIAAALTDKDAGLLLERTIGRWKAEFVIEHAKDNHE